MTLKLKIMGNNIPVLFILLADTDKAIRFEQEWFTDDEKHVHLLVIDHRYISLRSGNDMVSVLFLLEYETIEEGFLTVVVSGIQREVSLFRNRLKDIENKILKEIQKVIDIKGWTMKILE